MRQPGQTVGADGNGGLIPIRLPGSEAPVTSLTALEKVLKPRTSVPTQRYARFLTLDDEPLASAGVTTRYAAEHLKRMLQDLRGRTGRVDCILAGMDMGFFSLDHDWRRIFQALMEAGARAAPFQLLAIANYRRYLLHCLDALNQISTDRLQSALGGETESQGEERTQLAKASTAGYDSPRKREEVLVRDLVRLPKGPDNGRLFTHLPFEDPAGLQDDGHSSILFRVGYRKILPIMNIIQTVFINLRVRIILVR